MPATNARTGAATILVVDDDRDFTNAVSTVLQGEGYDVVVAGSGHDGLLKLEECHPDLIILDVMMETPTEGYGFTEAIKHSDTFEAYQQTPIFMVSSIPDSPDDLYPRAPETDMIRPDRYLTKPLDIPAFLEVIRKALRR